ncbi:hypothetical protein PINS_up023679 [Pythium insidiosum]|nr:hypothetical protein PINS_up004472 [Pythium insidiosum]GLE11313.1 hypothetical protein PINS_up023679 [Pythium insidiosum]
MAMCRPSTEGVVDFEPFRHPVKLEDEDLRSLMWVFAESPEDEEDDSDASV